MIDTITEDGEVISTDVLDMAIGQSVALARVEIDMQITTARAYPRQPSRVQKAILEMVMLDKESAAECMYALPVDGKPVTGPSIRFAEAVKQAFGNCSAAARTTEVNRAEKYVEAEGVFLDLETNTRTTFRTRRSIAGKNGRIYSDRMIVTTSNAAQSIAMREAILKGVPKPVWRSGYQAVLQTIKGDVKTLAERRSRAVSAFAVFGVSAEQVFTRMEVSGIEDLGLDELPELFAMFQSIKSGDATVEDYFGKPKPTHEVVANPFGDDGTQSVETVLAENGHKTKEHAASAANEASANGQKAGREPEATGIGTTEPATVPPKESGVTAPSSGAQEAASVSQDGQDAPAGPVEPPKAEAVPEKPAPPKTEAEYMGRALAEILMIDNEAELVSWNKSQRSVRNKLVFAVSPETLDKITVARDARLAHIREKTNG